jgi:hypothetical protein
LWEIPYTRALRYIHAALWANGAKTIKHKTITPDEISKLMALTEVDSEFYGDDF